MGCLFLDRSGHDSVYDNMDDSCARNEWGWNPQYDLERMTDDMILNLKKKLL